MKKETLDKYYPGAEKITISLPAILVKDGDSYFITFTEEAEAILGQSPYGQGLSREAAENQLWNMVRVMNHFNEDRARELDLWKPFQKGDWGHIGGTWFTVFGIHVYFRHGDNMKGGWYVPGTKLNISVNNYWRLPKKDNDRGRS